MKLKLGCLLVLLVLVLPPALAGRFLPWWGVILVAAGELALLTLVGPKLAGWAFKQFLMGLMGMKSRVLRGAQVEVHDVRRSARPGRADRFIDEDAILNERVADDGTESTLATAEAPVEDDPEEADRVYWQIDFTLRPRAGQSRMQFFDPDELMIVPFDAKVTLTEDPSEGDRAGDACQSFLREGEAWHAPEGKLPGVEQRLRVLFRCPPTLRGRVKFRYYFETFGEATLPG